MDEQEKISTLGLLQKLEHLIDGLFGTEIGENAVVVESPFETEIGREVGSGHDPVDLITRFRQDLRQVSDRGREFRLSADRMERGREAGQHGHVRWKGPGGSAGRRREDYAVLRKQIQARSGVVFLS